MQSGAERCRVDQCEVTRLPVEAGGNDSKRSDAYGPRREHPDGSVVASHSRGYHDLVGTECAGDVVRRDAVRHQGRHASGVRRLDIESSQLDEPIQLIVDVAAATDVYSVGHATQKRV